MSNPKKKKFSEPETLVDQPALNGLETADTMLEPEGTAVENGESQPETVNESKAETEQTIASEISAVKADLNATELEPPLETELKAIETVVPEPIEADPVPSETDIQLTFPTPPVESVAQTVLPADTVIPALDTPKPVETEDGVFTPDDADLPSSRLIQAPESQPSEHAGFLEEDGFLSDEVVIETSSAAVPDSNSMTLERGEYKISNRDEFGRTFATAPDGTQVMIVSYKSGAELTRTLYPHPMLPGLIDTIEQDGTTIIAHPKPEGRSLETAILESDKRAAVSAVVDLARFNRYVFARGFSLTGLDPRDILLSPTRLLRLPKVQKIGDTPSAEAPRYGAPERAAGLVVNGMEGVYSLGALLFHTLTGRALTEGELVQDFPTTPGAPQVFTNMLAVPEARASAGEALDLVTRLNQNFVARSSWQIGVSSSVGLNPDRSINEDSAGYKNSQQMGDAGRAGFLLACISDGMGGMAKGEAASQAAVRSFLEFDVIEVNTDIAKEATIEANRQVIAALEGKSGGCTFTGVMADGDKAVVSHVGDTRAYLVRGSRAEPVQQISDDHSMVAMLVKMGVISAEAAHNHPDSNKVMRALGSARDMGPEYVDAHEVIMRANDRLILVSDGVWGAFLPAEFEETVQLLQPPQDLADLLVRQALENGSSDNATAMVLEYQERTPL